MCLCVSVSLCLCVVAAAAAWRAPLRAALAVVAEASSERQPRCCCRRFFFCFCCRRFCLRAAVKAARLLLAAQSQQRTKKRRKATLWRAAGELCQACAVREAEAQQEQSEGRALCLFSLAALIARSNAHSLRPQHSTASLLLFLLSQTRTKKNGRHNASSRTKRLHLKQVNQQQQQQAQKPASSL